jgi:hypothetical protein
MNNTHIPRTSSSGYDIGKLNQVAGIAVSYGKRKGLLIDAILRRRQICISQWHPPEIEKGVGQRPTATQAGLSANLPLGHYSVLPDFTTNLR